LAENGENMRNGKKVEQKRLGAPRKGRGKQKTNSGKDRGGDFFSTLQSTKNGAKKGLGVRLKKTRKSAKGTNARRKRWFP